MHEKIIIIDDDVFYIGSLNALSHGRTTECMYRVQSPSAVKKLKKDWRVETDLARPEKEGNVIELFFNELPKEGNICSKCGKIMVRRQARSNPNNIFYSCSGFHSDGCRNIEDVSKTHLAKISRLTSIHCECGGPTRVESERKDLWIVCAATPSCGCGQPIKIKP
jgi:hypothetical protein